MAGIGKQFLAAAALLGLAVAFVGVGVRFSAAQAASAPDLSDLRDAVKAASKRGENVDAVVKALDSLEKAVAKGLAVPTPGKTPPPELVALRDAVEAAARKGENVEAILKELEIVEKAVTGQVLTRPKPAPPVEPPPVRPNPEPNRNPFGRPDLFPQPFPLPDGRGGLNPADIQKAQDLMRRAMEMMLKDPDDAEAKKLMEESRDLMLRALTGRGGRLDLGIGPAVGRGFRLGIRMERLTPTVVEQLGIENGRGVVVAEVIEGSVAAKVGFKPHDIVMEFAGKAVSDTPEDLTRIVNDVKAGEKVDAVVLRKGKKIELKGIELPEGQQQQANPRLPIENLKPPVPDGRQPGGQPRLPVPGILPDIKPLPFPAFPGIGDNGRGRGKANGNSVATTVTNGTLTIKATQDGVNYVITGTKGDEIVVEKVSIMDGDKKPVEVASVKDVPEDYRPVVEKLVKNAAANRAATRRN